MTRRQQLGELLLERQLISEHDLRLVLTEQVIRKQRLGELIYEKKLVGKDDLVCAIEDLTHCKFCDLEGLRPDIQALRLLPIALAQKHCCFPIRLNSGSIEIAIAEPQNLVALNELAFATGLRVVPFLCFQADIRNAINLFYRPDMSQLEVTAIPLRADPATDGGDIEFISASSRQAHKDSMYEMQANERGQKTEAVSLVSSIMASALQRKASDIHFEQQSDGLVVRIRVDGVLRNLLRVSYRGSCAAHLTDKDSRRYGHLRTACSPRWAVPQPPRQ